MSSLTVTFDEVLAAARLGRARVAPEMAGYLALGVADALVGHPFLVEPRNFALNDEGAIFIGAPALTKAASPAELEEAVRKLLGSLLEVSRGGGGGLGTLLTVAGRPSEAHVGALVTEIEAALIPVNRAAARRALARLARETAKARDEGQLHLAGAVTHEASREPDEDTEPLRVPVRAESAPTEASPEPPKVEAEESAPSPEPPRVESQPPKAAPSSPPKSRADELLARFSGSVAQSEQEIARELKAMAGLEPTPPPPIVATAESTIAPEPTDIVEAVAEVTPSEEVEDSFEIPTARRSKATSYLLGGLLVAGIAATLAVWIYYPEFFTGR